MNVLESRHREVVGKLADGLYIFVSIHPNELHQSLERVLTLASNEIINILGSRRKIVFY